MKCWTMLKTMFDENQTSFSTVENLNNILQQGGQTSATYLSQPLYDVASVWNNSLLTHVRSVIKYSDRRLTITLNFIHVGEAFFIINFCYFCHLCN